MVLVVVAERVCAVESRAHGRPSHLGVGGVPRSAALVVRNAIVVGDAVGRGGGVVVRDGVARDILPDHALRVALEGRPYYG